MQRNRQDSKNKLLKAVGELLTTAGYKGLGVNKVAKQAGLDKKLIYLYFGSLDDLIAQYLCSTDYWITFLKVNKQSMTNSKFSTKKKIMEFYLEKQLMTLFHNRQQQQIVKWDINGDKEQRVALQSMEKEREQAFADIFDLLDLQASRSELNYRAVLTVLIAAINYLGLHANVTSTTFCEIDLHDDFRRAEIVKTIKMISNWALEAV